MPNNRKRLVGRVISDKMDKTVVVAIDIIQQHRIYKKVVRTTKKIYAHDESNEIPVGTVVRVVESRPNSKLKRWVVEDVVRDTGNMVVEKVSMEAQDEAVIEALEEDLQPEPPTEPEAAEENEENEESDE